MVSSVFERIGSAASAFMVFLAFFPYSGIDTQPPQHFSVYGNRVPDDSPWLALGVAVFTLAVIELAVRRVHRARPG